jgi:hypothetical protein
VALIYREDWEIREKYKLPELLDLPVKSNPMIDPNRTLVLEYLAEVTP